jgi:hypothetical protein
LVVVSVVGVEVLGEEAGWVWCVRRFWELDGVVRYVVRVRLGDPGVEFASR